MRPLLILGFDLIARNTSESLAFSRRCLNRGFEKQGCMILAPCRRPLLLHKALLVLNALVARSETILKRASTLILLLLCDHSRGRAQLTEHNSALHRD